MIPILVNHAKPIGSVSFDEGRMVATFGADSQITTEMVFEIFGNVGFRILESVGDFVRVVQIFEFSLREP